MNKAFYLLAGGVRVHHGGMNTADTKTTACLQPAEVLAQQLARLASHWVARQIAPDIPLECASDVISAWRAKTPLELALLPDAQRALAAATQELLTLLAQSPDGRQALDDLGFKPFLEDIERP